MKLAEVLPQEDFVLYVVSEDGKKGLFDVAPYLDAEAFLPLKDGREFERIYNGEYFVEWDCGADLSADTIEARWQTLEDNTAEQVTQLEHS